MMTDPSKDPEIQPSYHGLSGDDSHDNLSMSLLLGRIFNDDEEVIFTDFIPRVEGDFACAG